MFVNFCLIWNCSPAQHHLLRFGQNKTRKNTLTPIVNKCNTKCVPSSVNQIKESTEQLDVILKTPFLIFTFLLELMKTSVLVKVMLNIPKFSLASLSSKLFLKWETNKRLNVLKKKKRKNSLCEVFITAVREQSVRKFCRTQMMLPPLLLSH